MLPPSPHIVPDPSGPKTGGSRGGSGTPAPLRSSREAWHRGGSLCPGLHEPGPPGGGDKSPVRWPESGRKPAGGRRPQPGSVQPRHSPLRALPPAVLRDPWPSARALQPLPPLPPTGSPLPRMRPPRYRRGAANKLVSPAFPPRLPARSVTANQRWRLCDGWASEPIVPPHKEKEVGVQTAPVPRGGGAGRGKGLRPDS